ncbi:four helix bundle protein [Candidatus Peribacteria bacterium]|jgi:four helix bundle protein|nr:four helix bundle protein [Candidatus Peribacteria bacterium]MBT4020857.1 four helix bundle protein [Candidatus Peribacteria bacterium]MBT4241146.1 four helix bundle protein [Candidatus Peribacteria bacterium]MBT4473868.1 four helix bundle protein [Candidatus Peribacteria bacterium]
MRERIYQKLIVWKEADALCLRTYKETKKFPAEEKYCLVQQMRRASYGIPMCIVEGNMRRTTKDKRYFLTQSIGSLEELHYQYSLAYRLGYIKKADFEDIDEHIGRVSYLLNKLYKSLK